MVARTYRPLTDKYIEAASDFAEGETRMLWDSKVRGLQLRIGKNRRTWSFFQEHRIKGRRSTTCRRLGFWPVLDVKAARKEALVVAGRAAAGQGVVGRKQSVKFADALDGYIERAKSKGKSGAWARNLEGLKRTHLAEFSGWTLKELSDAPGPVKDWHRRITKDNGPNIADQAARALRAIYNVSAKLDRNLDLSANPCSAIEYNGAERSQTALAFARFPEWFAAWQGIENPTRKAFQMLNLLCGCRPGELSRLKWADVLPRQRCFVIKAAKAGNNIRIPFSTAIVRELRRARDACEAGDVYVFPARAGGHVVKFDVDGLPAWGMMLRRTYRTICAECEVDELLSHFLMGHKPLGISRGYVSKMILSSGPAMAAAQRKVSARIGRMLAP